MPETPAPSREQFLQEFVDWAAVHITGDEKGQAQVLSTASSVPSAARVKDAHAALDAAVLAAYGFTAKQDLLAQLLALNLAVSAREKAGDPVTPPGIPTICATPEKLITNDCICP